MTGAGTGTDTLLATTRAAQSARATTSVGMAIALGAIAMCFAALLLGYAILRAQAASWPPPGEAAVPRSWSWLFGATLAALAGSAAMRLAVRIDDGSAPGRLRSLLIATALAGVTFIAVQIAGWLWLSYAGIRPSSGIVASVVYALTLFHALHALAGLIALAPLLLGALRKKAIGAAALGAVSSFWHLVTIAWLVVFVAVFVA